ncbi:MAG TPA: methyltransferase domain-containing protein [Acidimicrobiia bacterium]|nr:methyltransferase domain-containing protein [Acidimicrobiia bacterium]
MPFEDDEFDLVAATLAVHNVEGDSGRGEAVRELARVTSSTGQILILDFSGIDLYASELRVAGCDPQVSGSIRSMFPWCRVVQASRK